MTNQTENVWYVDVTTTYRVTQAISEEDARDLVEAYEDGHPHAKERVSVKDQSVYVESAF